MLGANALVRLFTTTVSVFRSDGTQGMAVPMSANLAPPPEPPISPIADLELSAFMEALGGEPERAVAALEAKQAWARSMQTTITEVAPFYRSEGSVFCVEGLQDAAGWPIILSNGMAHGSPSEVMQQVCYAHERVLQQCAQLGRPVARATTVVVTRNPTFRFPDAALRAAIEATEKLPVGSALLVVWWR